MSATHFSWIEFFLVVLVGCLVVFIIGLLAYSAITSLRKKGAILPKSTIAIENVKFSTFGSLSHITLIGGYLILILIFYSFIHSAISQKLTDTGLGHLSSLSTQITQGVFGLVNGIFGFWLGTLRKKNEGEIS